MDSKRNSDIVWYPQGLFMVAFTALHPRIICYVLVCDTLAVHHIFPCDFQLMSKTWACGDPFVSRHNLRPFSLTMTWASGRRINASHVTRVARNVKVGGQIKEEKPCRFPIKINFWKHGYAR